MSRLARILLACIVLSIGMMACTKPYSKYENRSVPIHKFAHSISKSYSDNPIRFNNQYIGKNVLFHGKISRIDKFGDITFIDQIFAIYTIRCENFDSQYILDLNKGDKVYINGILKSVNIPHIYVDNCRSVEK